MNRPPPATAEPRTAEAALPSAAAAAAACATHEHGRSSAAASTDHDASLTGGIARALAAGGSALSRVGGALFRVPLKAFRQNKFHLDEGHLHPSTLVEAQTAAATVGAKGSAKKPSPLRILAAQQGLSAVLLKQVAPSLVANVAVGSVMFSAFDHTIAALAQMQARGSVPQWMCSSALSSGYVAPSCAVSPSCAVDPAIAAPSFLQPFVGPDVLLAGMVAGASQTPLVTPMENSAAWIRIKYRFLEAHLHAGRSASTAASAAAAGGAAASAACPHGMAGVSTAAVEATATTLLPPLPPHRIHSLNIASSLLEMARRGAGGTANLSGSVTPSAAAAVDSTSSSLRPLGAPLHPSHGLFSHFSLRLTRDSLGLGIFFFSFESVLAQLRVVPYRWMEVQEERERIARRAARLQMAQGQSDQQQRGSAVAPAASSFSSSSSSSSAPSDLSDLPSTALLGSMLAWECVSVVGAGVVAGCAHHLVSYPFFHALQQVENEALRRTCTPLPRGQPPALSAWGHLAQLHREHGVRGLFRGAWGGPTAAQIADAATAGQHLSSAVAHAGRRPSLFNALVIGLIFYTLSKSEHHSHQLRQWRLQRRLARQAAKKQKAIELQQAAL